MSATWPTRHGWLPKVVRRTIACSAARVRWGLALGAAICAVLSGAIAWWSVSDIARRAVQIGGPEFVAVTPPGVVELGDGKPNEVLRGSIAFRNDGDQPLEYKMHASCGCTVLNPLSGAVAPGCSQSVEVGITLRELSNSTRSASVTVITNDRRAPRIQYVVKGKAPSAFLVSPTHVDRRRHT